MLKCVDRVDVLVDIELHGNKALEVWTRKGKGNA
jgi:hypothetical protein